MPSQPDISICVATFRRPQGLERLLGSLEPSLRQADFSVEIVVVDNDAGQSARPVAERAAKTLPALRYCVEPRQSIAHARNRAVEEAHGNWIAFIDDDEVAEADWLAGYWRMVATRPADGYFGPVISRLDGEPPSWLDPEVFLSRPPPQSERPVGAEHTRTGNALIRRSLLAAERFDPRFGLTGGSDFELFSRLIAAGRRFFWCPEARTYEHYPASRLRVGWILQRAFRGGYTYTLIDRLHRPGWRSQSRRVAKAIAAVVAHAALLPMDALRGATRAVQRMARIAVQLGHLWAFFDLSYEEYRLPSGSPDRSGGLARP